MDFVENVGRRSDVAGDNGNFIDVGIFSLNGYERNALYKNLGNGKFLDVGHLEGADRIEDGRGLGILDADSDGDMDLLLGNYLQPARLLVNHAPEGTHWLRLWLQGTRSPRSALGARVMVQHGARRQYRDVCATAGYLSGQSLYLHFGLAGDRSVDRLVVYWPSGLVQELKDVPADRFYRVVEGAEAPVPVFQERPAPAPVPVPARAGPGG
ncbi:MAG: CRTAC1 family protein [Planctomycetes bacterium]|nr:CRTAC1 family protein [Planctomycetota bacterium]